MTDDQAAPTLPENASEDDKKTATLFLSILTPLLKKQSRKLEEKLARDLRKGKKGTETVVCPKTLEGGYISYPVSGVTFKIVYPDWTLPVDLSVLNELSRLLREILFDVEFRWVPAAGEAAAAKKGRLQVSFEFVRSEQRLLQPPYSHGITDESVRAIRAFATKLKKLHLFNKPSDHKLIQNVVSYVYNCHDFIDLDMSVQKIIEYSLAGVDVESEIRAQSFCAITIAPVAVVKLSFFEFLFSHVGDQLRGMKLSLRAEGGGVQLKLLLAHSSAPKLAQPPMTMRVQPTNSKKRKLE
jgi:hypothetical protein